MRASQPRALCVKSHQHSRSRTPFARSSTRARSWLVPDASSVPGGNGDPRAITLAAGLAFDALRDNAALAISSLIAVGAIDAEREKRSKADEQTRKEFGFDDGGGRSDGDALEANFGGDGGNGRRTNDDSYRGWDDDDDEEEGDLAGNARTGRRESFIWVRGGRRGAYWVAGFLASAWYCYFITNDPYMGTLWLACAIGTGWGLFLVFGAASVVVFAANFGLQQYLANTLVSDMSGNDDAIERLLNNNREARLIASGRYRSSIPEMINDSTNSNPYLNPNLPDDVSIVGTDTQIAQIKLKPGEEVAASPGAMCYMSSNVISITSLGQNGLAGAIARTLAGEPFFINTFRNLGQTDGYVAVGGLEPGDKIAVIELKDEVKSDILCARDSYMCSKGSIRISAAAAVRTDAEAEGQTFMEMLKYRVGFALRLVLSKGNSIFNGEWLAGDGLVCVTGKGTVMRRTLKANEEMVVDSRSVMALERSVGYSLEVATSPLAAIFGGAGLFFVRLKGPGTFYLQSLPAQKQLDSGVRIGGRKLKVKAQT